MIRFYCSKNTYFGGENLKSLFLRISFQLKYTNLEEQKSTGKNRVSVDFLLFLLYRFLLYKNMLLFFLETSISENMGDFKGKDCILKL